MMWPFRKSQPKVTLKKYRVRLGSLTTDEKVDLLFDHMLSINGKIPDTPDFTVSLKINTEYIETLKNRSYYEKLEKE